MQIRTSIYDFFAYAIPGGLLLILIVINLDLFGVVSLWAAIWNSNLFQISAIILCSYIVGHITRMINRKWMQIFESRPIPKLAMSELKERHPTLKININPDDWQIWSASIRRENTEFIYEIDRSMATSYFLCGLSSFLALLGVSIIIFSIFGKISLWYIATIPFIALFSFIAIKESIKFNKWFYFLIFELVLSREEPFHFAKKEESKPNKTE